MSFSAMAWASKQKTGKSSAKFVLLMLADRANEKGVCYPSLDRIASDCEMSRGTVISNIKILSESGFIRVVHRVKDGVSLPNHYHLIMNNSTETGSAKLGGVVQKLNGGSAKFELGGSAKIEHKPITSSNLSINPISFCPDSDECETEQKPKVKRKTASEKRKDTIDQRRTAFIDSIATDENLERFGADMIKSFIRYWVEHSDRTWKMRFENEKFFQINSRLAYWEGRSIKK